MRRAYRVPAAYPTCAFLAFLAYLALHKINNLRVFNTGPEFDSHPGHHFFFFDYSQLTASHFPRNRRVTFHACARQYRGSTPPAVGFDMWGT